MKVNPNDLLNQSIQTGLTKLEHFALAILQTKLLRKEEEGVVITRNNYKVDTQLAIREAQVFIDSLNEFYHMNDKSNRVEHQVTVPLGKTLEDSLAHNDRHYSDLMTNTINKEDTSDIINSEESDHGDADEKTQS